MYVHGTWGRVESKPWFCQMAESKAYVCTWHMGEGRVQTWLCQMAGSKAYVCTWHVHVGEGTVQTWLCQMAWNQCYVCMSCGGVYGPNLIVSNCWKSILWVWRRVRYKPDCFKWLEINHLCAWQVEEGTVQTWPCQMAGNQSYVCTACGGEGTVQTCVKWLYINPMCVHCIWRRVQFKPDSVKWLEIKPMYVHGMWRRAKAKPNCVKWLEVKPMCVHCKWRRVQSKPDCVKWLEIKPICVDSMLHVLCKYCCYCCDMKPVTWPLLFFNRKKCYLSIDMFIYSTFAELNLLFIHTFYSVKHLKNIYIAHFYLACWQQ